MAKSNNLQRQIRYVEENIKLKEQLGKDTSFEKDLVKAWKE